jgi:phage gpG-like protein
MLQVTVNLSQVEDIQDKLDKLGEKLYTFDLAMATIGQSLAEYYAGPAFDSQGGAFASDDDGGGLWPALNPAYALYKAKHYGTPIMVALGTPHMRDLFTYESDDNSVTVGNTASYFQYHQSTEERTGNLPRREMIGVNETVKGLINDIINADIRDKIASV